MTDDADLRYPELNPRHFRLTIAVFKFLIRLLARPHIGGLENVPVEGPVIYASNHLHHLDTPLIGISLPRQGYVLAAEKYQGHIFEPILRVGGAIFINRGEADRRALRQALNVLEDGNALGVAVEGTRSHTGGLAEGKTGAAYLATRSGATIVPLAVWGTEKIIPAWRHLRRADIYVQYGEPIHLPQGRARSAELDVYTEQIMLALARLLPPAYRGVYADHPALAESSPED
jgi:1-acyl-sn-glycerol-3-phosphate acyltransferase